MGRKKEFRFTSREKGGNSLFRGVKREGRRTGREQSESIGQPGQGEEITGLADKRRGSGCGQGGESRPTGKTRMGAGRVFIASGRGRCCRTTRGMSNSKERNSWWLGVWLGASRGKCRVERNQEAFKSSKRRERTLPSSSPKA